MRAAFILVFVANVVLSLVSLVLLPPRVAIHFGLGGMANGWAPSYVNNLFFIGTNVFLFFSIHLSPRLVLMFPAKWINLPNKDYWLQLENKARTVEMFSSLMWELGILLFLFLFVVELLAIEANLSQPVRLNEKLFLSALTLFLLYTAYWCIRLFGPFASQKKWEVPASLLSSRENSPIQLVTKIVVESVNFPPKHFAHLAFWIFKKRRNSNPLLTLSIAMMRQVSFKPRMGKRRIPPDNPPKKPPNRSAA